MKSPIIKPFGTALSVIVLLLALNSCETWRQDCVGQIIVENEIPDITLYVGGEPFERDLFAHPVVFKHTKNQTISISSVLAEDHTIVNPNLTYNDAKEISLVEIIPLKEGNTEVVIIAIDNCVDYQMATTFNVTVIDTTLN